MNIVLKGVEQSQKWAEKYQRGLSKLHNSRLVMGSALPYAWGIHFGRHRRSGKLARRSGGIAYLTDAVEKMQAGAVGDISEGLNKVSAPGPWILKRLGLWARRLARQLAPRGPAHKPHKYRLRRSINIQRRA